MAPRNKGLILSQGWVKAPHPSLGRVSGILIGKNKQNKTKPKTKTKKGHSRQINNRYFRIYMILLDSKIMFFYYYYFFNEMMAILLDGEVAGVWLVIFVL